MIEYDTIGAYIALDEDAILFAQGEAPQSVAVVCVGRMKLVCSSRQGKTLLVRLAKPGDVLGLSAALSNTPHEVTAQAIEHVQIKISAVANFFVSSGTMPRGACTRLKVSTANINRL